MGGFLLSEGETVLFIGDSITDCGRKDGKTSSSGQPLGDGYVKLFSDLVCARHPGLSLNCVNRGIGGNTIFDLRDRWDRDVIKVKPDWLSVMIGINDLHRYLRGDEKGNPPEIFRREYENLLDKTPGQLKSRMVLIDPFYICAPGDKDPFRKKVMELIPAYISAVRELAAGSGAVHVRTHETFQEHLKRRSPDVFCPEPVHPNMTGHLVIAWELLKSLHE